ncbi:Mce protein [Mycobacterium sp. NPDC050551]|uniref:Mce protein n=1 Tax=Mycobacterium sp. NPDC050551 TaxID=3155407 RepID=UPI00341AA5DA
MPKHAAPADWGVDGDVDEPDAAVESESEDAGSDTEADVPHKQRRAPWSLVRLATVAGLVVVLALGGLSGWLGYQGWQARQAEQQRERFVETGRQGVLNLTSVDWQQADVDVQRILDASTGGFYDQFQKRAAPYTEVVKQAKSKSVGTIQQAGLESVSDTGDSAKVLVAVSIAASNAGAPDQPLRYWRMRVTVDEIDGQMKVSDVEFVQ